MPGFKKEHVISQVSKKFKINEHKVSRWFSNGSGIIKKATPYYEILRYQKAFAQLGVKCELVLVTNISGFKSALVKPVDIANNLRQYTADTLSYQTKNNKRKQHSLYTFDLRFFRPKFINLEKETSINNEQHNPVFSITRDTRKLGIYSVYIITFLATLFFQENIINLAMELFSNKTLGTMIGLVSFFLLQHDIYYIKS